MTSNYFSGLLALPLFLLFFHSSAQASEAIDLQTALNEKSISIECSSNGGYSEASVAFVARNLTNKKLEIRIPAGTLFEPENEEEQTLIQLEDELFVLEKNGTKSLILDAYCTESSDRCPHGAFGIASNKNEGLSAFIQYIGEHETNPTFFQDAVWSITDDESITHIVRENEPAEAMRTFLADLTGQEDGWYEAPQNRTVDENGYINRETVEINGMVKFKAESAMSIVEEIYDADGNILFENDPFDVRAGNVTYEFRLRVKGWKKGSYTVKVKDASGNDLLTNVFEV